VVRAATRWLGRPAAMPPRGARRAVADQPANGREPSPSDTFRALLEINKKINPTAPTDTLLTAIAEEAARLLDVDNAGFRLVEGDELVVAGLAGTARETMSRQRIGRHESLSGLVATEGRALMCDLDSVADLLIPEHLAADRRLGYVSFLVVPLRVGERTIGVLTFRARRRFTPRDQDVAEAFAGQAALALEQARLYRDSQRQAERMAALAAVERLVAETLDADVVAQRIVDSVCDLLGARSSVLYRMDTESDRLLAVTVARETWLTFEWARALPPDQGIAGLALRERCPVLAEDSLLDDRIVYGPDTAERIGRSTDRALLAAPLIVRDRVFGVLAVGDRTGRRFSQEDVSLAEAFAHQAAIALENARLFALEASRRAQSEALAEVEREMAAELDPDRLLQLIVDRAARLFGGDCLIYLARGQRLRVAAASPGYEDEPELAFGQGLTGVAAQTRQGFLVNDYAQSEHAIARYVTRGESRAMGSPLVLRDRLLGVIGVFRTGADQPRFTADDHAVLDSFANQAAIALENARLHEETERRRRTAEHLAELGRLLSQSLDPEEVGQRIVESVRALFGVLRCALYGAAPSGDELVVLGFSNDPSLDPGFGRDLIFRRGFGVVGLAMSERRLVTTPNLLDDTRIVVTPEVQASFAASPVRSLLALPLFVGDTVTGVLATGDRAGRVFDDEEIRVLRAFADQAAIALENARLYRRAREYSDRLLRLDEVNRVVSSSLQTREVLQNITAAVAQFFDAPYVAVWVYDPVQRRARRSLAHGDPDVASGLKDELAVGESLVGWVLEHRAPILWTDVEHDPRAFQPSRMTARGLHYFTVYPIAIGDRLLGVFSLSRATPPAAPVPETDSLLGSLAAQAALALDHARLFAETERRLDEARALLEVANILTSTLDSRRLLRQVAMKIAQVCRVDRCSFSLWDGEHLIPVMSQFADGRREPALWSNWTRTGPHPAQTVGAHAEAIATRRPVIIDDAARSDLVPRHWVEAYGVKSCMLVPLLRQDTVIGLMNLDRPEQVPGFEPWQSDLAMAIAGQLALSLENTRLYGEAQERLRETTTLLDIARVLSEPGTTEEVMRRVAREVGRAFGADMVGAYALDARREALVALAGYHVPEGLREFFRTRPIVLDRSPGLRELWRQGRSLTTSDSLNDLRLDAEWTGVMPPHSVLFSPTQVRGESVGGLFLVWWRTGRTFTPAEVRLLEGVSAQVGLALENADLSRQTQAKLRETETLLSVSRALSATLDLAALYRHFLRRVASTLGADSVGIWLLAEDGEWLEPHAGYRVPADVAEVLRGARLSIDKHELYAEAARTLRPIFSRDVSSDPRLPAGIRERVPHRSQLFVPLVTQGRFIGGFAAAWWEREAELASGDLDLMEAIANQAAIAIANARLFQQNRRQVDELSVLYELSRAVTGQLDRGALMDAVATQMARVMDARQMVALLVDETQQDLEVVFRIEDGVRQPAHQRYPLRGVGLQATVLRTGRPVRTDDYAAECARHGVEVIVRTALLPYWLGVPMTVGEETFGVIALKSGERAFTAGDERLLTNIGQVTALALRSVRLFEERKRAYGELAAAQDQLVRTEKLRALGEMASGVAHDFNNLLAAILGRAQLLQRYVRDAKLAGWLQVIERSAVDGAQTVRRLQEFARVRRDQPFAPVDLNEVVRDAIEMTQSRWREDALRQGVVIDVRTATAPEATVAGDAAELREAMTNLILNAVDAMPRGGTITASTEIVGDTVQLSVSDTGTGIPEAVRERIFDPFFTTKGPQGTGLGLSMTYGILSRHGARIAVESEEGRGSTFRITFARGEAREPAAPQPVDEPVAAVESLRCLVVDDERAVATVLGDVLEASGHRVVVLTDGAEAIARVQREPFDVVFTDLAMPRVSGWDVAHAVKASAPGVPVFLVTGFGVELSAAERRTHGVAEVFSKPLRIEDITRAVAYASRYTGERPAPEAQP
jgi:GAF domain-containing protein/ActR/RegA family two-component response regulator/anti-sigma regulatory factor (Ser/Thr protein kinase)